MAFNALIWLNMKFTEITQQIKGFVYFLFIILLTSCQPTYCTKGVFVNNSDHTISIITYSRGRIVAEESVITPMLTGEKYELAVTACIDGGPSAPFPSWDIDSVAVIFNDTLRVRLINSFRVSDLFGQRSPLWFTNWVETHTSAQCVVYFEYEFTNWHFQQAVAYTQL